MDPIDSIFHEKQEGALCAQHCLNNLLQGQYFSPVDLAEIARQLDDCERERMAEGGTQSEEYRNFIAQPSSNFDDSGFFSIQVIASALRVWNLDVIPFTSQDASAVAARADPVCQKAFICNFHEHWFTIRKLGRQWFNLNSLLTGPELISDTYLSLFLSQLQQEGYSIFVLIGDLPHCDAEQILTAVHVQQPIKPRLINEKQITGDANSQASTDSDPELAQALAASRNLNERDDRVLQKTLALSWNNDEEALLQRALEMSMKEMPSTSVDPNSQPPTTSGLVDDELVRERRIAYLSRNNDAPSEPVTYVSSSTSLLSTEEEMLRAAIQLSMEQP